MKKQIAYLGIKGVPYSGGAERVVEGIIQHMDPARYAATVYCHGRFVAPEAGYPGVVLKRTPALPGKYLGAPSHFLFSALHALLRGNYDLIHLHNVESAFILPLLRLRYRVVATSHGQAQARDKWGPLAKKFIAAMEVPFLALSNAATSVSAPLADYYRARYKRAVHYIPNGIPAQERVDERAAQEALEANGLTPGGYIMFAAGRIIPTKGCRLLLHAFRALDTDVKLLIVGDASQMSAYQRELQELADERVRFVPFIAAKATLLGLIASSRLFVFPSRVEAMSMMLLEAATVGAPLVSSDIPENTAVLPEEALFFTSGEASDLRAKLEWALAHPDEMAALGRAAQERVTCCFRWERIVAAYETLYDATLQDGPAPALLLDDRAHAS